MEWEQPPRGTDSSPPRPLPYPPDSHVFSSFTARMPTRMQDLLAPPPYTPTCLATSYQWGEIIQVVDMVEELGRRGLNQAQAHAVLDSGMALGFSLMVSSRWVMWARKGGGLAGKW